MALTSASGFEVGATVAELEARVVAVARLVRGVLDDRVYGRLLDDTRRVPAGTAKFGLQATARAGYGRGGDDERQQDDRGRRGGTTSHRVSIPTKPIERIIIIIIIIVSGIPVYRTNAAAVYYR